MLLIDLWKPNIWIHPLTVWEVTSNLSIINQLRKVLYQTIKSLWRAFFVVTFHYSVFVFLENGSHHNCVHREVMSTSRNVRWFKKKNCFDWFHKFNGSKLYFISNFWAVICDFCNLSILTLGSPVVIVFLGVNSRPFLTGLSSFV